LTDLDGAEARRHGLWGLGVLVMIAIVVVSFMILFTGGNDGSGPANSQDLTTLSGALGTSHPPARHPSSPHSATTHPSSTTPSGCAGSTSCAQGADVTAVAAGINALRTGAGLKAVPAAASPNAQQCAIAHGSGPTCVPHYMWSQTNSPTAAAAVAALQRVNRAWLLDPSTTRFEIGYVRGADGGYDCAVLKFP